MDGRDLLRSRAVKNAPYIQWESDYLWKNKALYQCVHVRNVELKLPLQRVARNPRKHECLCYHEYSVQIQEESLKKTYSGWHFFQDWKNARFSFLMFVDETGVSIYIIHTDLVLRHTPEIWTAQLHSSALISRFLEQKSCSVSAILSRLCAPSFLWKGSWEEESIFSSVVEIKWFQGSRCQKCGLKCQLEMQHS